MRADAPTAKRREPAKAPVKSAAITAADAPALAPKLTAIEISALLIATVVVIAAARIAQPFLVPVIAGILLSYALRPLVSWLERRRVPRVFGAAVVVVTLLVLLSATAYAIRDDVNSAVAELPAAARKVRIAVTKAMRESPGPMTHMKEAARELDQAAAEASGKPSSAPATNAPADPVTAQFQGIVVDQSSKVMSVFSEILLAMLLSFFLLAAGDTFRRKVAKLAGASLARRRVTIEVLNEIDGQIQAYLLTLLIANVLIALASWGALTLLGLPNAGMWGMVTGALHVIPYAGTVVSALGVGVAMFLHSGSITQAMLAIAVLAAIATLIGIGLTTWMQGRAFRMNAVAIFIGVLFFGWLWGGWGLLLGLPILAVVKSISDRVESLHPIGELLGD